MKKTLAALTLSFLSFYSFAQTITYEPDAYDNEKVNIKQGFNTIGYYKKDA